MTTSTPMNLLHDILLAEFKERIPEYVFSFEEIHKANENYTALIIREKDSNLGVMMREDDLLDGEQSVLGIVKRVKDFIAEHNKETENMKNLITEAEANIANYEWAKDHLILAPVGYNASPDFFEGIPTIELAFGLSIMARVLLRIDNAVMTTTQVTFDLMQTWGIDKDTLFKDAKISSTKIRPVRLEDFAPIPGASPMKLLTTTSPDAPTSGSFLDRLLSQQCNPAWGAAAIAYPGAIKSISDKFKERVFVLPSSVHELILIPESEAPFGSYDETVHHLKDMVRSINDAEVVDKEKLSYTVYIIDNGELKVA